MRAYFWSCRGDWHEYFCLVVSVRRLSGTKWEVEYWKYPFSRHYPALQKIIVIADKAWVEVYNG